MLEAKAAWTCLPVPPRIKSIACSATPPKSNASKFSLTALTLPGRVTMRVSLIVPATGLDRAAKGVCVKDVDIIRCTRPGAFFSMRGEIACNQGIVKKCWLTSISLTSGVLSRTPKPVPPVVTIQSALRSSQQPLTNSWIWVSSSGTMVGDLQSNPRS